MTRVSDPEIRAFVETARRFARAEIAPRALEADRYPFADFPSDLYKKMAEAGLLAPALPERFGGPGLGVFALTAVLRTLAQTDASVAALVLVQSLAGELVADGLPEDDARAVLSDPCRLFALPLYSDPEEPADDVRAVPVESGYVLSGTAEYLAGLPVAGYALVPARAPEGFGLFLVSTGEAGVFPGEPIVGLGLRASPAADLRLEKAWVPGKRVWPAPGRFGEYAGIIDKYRLVAAGMSLGVLEGALAAATEYAQGRHQARQLIVRHHMVRRMLVGMTAWIEVGDAALESAAGMPDNEVESFHLRSLAVQELISTAAARRTADAVQVLGGYGYMHDYGQEKRMRDAKQLQAVFGGADRRIMNIADAGLGDRG